MPVYVPGSPNVSGWSGATGRRGHRGHTVRVRRSSLHPTTAGDAAPTAAPSAGAVVLPNLHLDNCLP
eukprot:3028558-Rhodomonas_salina.1